MPTRRKAIRRTERIPNGFLYRADFISEQEELRLLDEIRQLPLEHAKYQGYVARRRIVEFGFEYSFESRQASAGAPLPAFLLPLRTSVAELVSGTHPEDLVEAVVTEYPEGATMGWHRDAPQFGTVFGVSLAAHCRMRLRLTTKEDYQITSLDLAPRSAYVLQDEARWKWQHSIPAVEKLRYSITFRTLRSRVPGHNRADVRG